MTIVTEKSGKIAALHPGRLGDAIYCLPTIRWLCAKHGCQADFYTTAYCESLRRLFEYQDCIDQFVAPPGTGLREDGQNWLTVEVSAGYQAVYRLNWPRWPDRFLVDCIAEGSRAPDGLPVYYEHPGTVVGVTGDYVVFAPACSNGQVGGLNAAMEGVAKEVQVVQVGAPGDFVVAVGGLDWTGRDFLDTCSLLAVAMGFVGQPSANLALANGFSLPKVSTHRDDMSHVLWGPSNYYLQQWRTGKLLDILRQRFCKTLDPDDFDGYHEIKHVDDVRRELPFSAIEFGHKYRCWEYGMAAKVLRLCQCRSVLEVGGVGFLFAASAAWLGMTVTVVDSRFNMNNGMPVRTAFTAVRARLSACPPMHLVTADFATLEDEQQYDGVACLSVLEHIVDDEAFFRRLLARVAPGGVLVLTVDFHPDGRQHVAGHLRTYNATRLGQLIAVAAEAGFRVFGGQPDYVWCGPAVYDYTFALLALVRD